MFQSNIRGIPVSFPLEPYPCQINYMDRVILALEKGKNAILESPTGTGKTLCLLCATLAWREHQKLREVDHEAPPPGAQGCHCSDGWGHEQPAQVSKIPKVIYASRTHSQLSQVVHELNKTAYRPRVSIIGSRDRLCIHPGVVSKESNVEKIHACRAKINSDNCGYYSNFTRHRSKLGERIVDMEDLISACRAERICPYYTARELSKTAEFILMPYNYVLSPKLQEVHGIDLSNVILILDEAHNVPKACEEANSFDITTKNISSCSSDLQYLFKKLKEQHEVIEDGDNGDDEPSRDCVEDIVNLKVLMDNFLEALDKISLNEQGQISKDGSFILEFLETIGITHQTVETLLSQCENVITMLTQGGDTVRRSGNNMQHFLDFIRTVFGVPLNEQSSCFRVFVKEEEKQKDQSVWTVSTTAGPSRKTTRTLSYWCFSAGYTMSAIALATKSIILTSGTLRPLDSFAAELKVPFPVTLENPHVIGSEQVWVGVAVSGPDNVTLNSSYAQRDSIDYRRSLGNSIVNLARVVPNGVLVFFSSYSLMSGCIETWRNEGGILQRIEQHKPVFFEPKQKSSLQDTMDAFYAKINDPEHCGAIFFAVCRGKVSEGLDFVDANGRAVIITGIPYPPRMDPKVKLKMQYLNAVKSLTLGLSGEQWYQQQATRAVNQAVGRVIRHNRDYGAIILCDERFSYSDNINQLPQWLVPYSQTYSSFGGLLRDLSRFFKSAETKFGCSKQPTKTFSKEAADPGSSSLAVPIQARLSSRKEAMRDVQKASTVDMHVVKEDKPSYCLGEQQDRSSTRAVEQRYPTHASLPKRRIEYEDKDKSLMHSLSLVEGASLDNQHIVRLHEPITKEPKNSPKLSDVIFQSSSVSSSSSGQSKPAKKLIIKKRSASTRVDQDAISYISNLQESLSIESYKDFKKSLALYKQAGDFPQLMTTIREVFKYPSQHALLHGFKRYVRKEHKTAFDDECFKLTGSSSGTQNDNEDFKVPKIPRAEATHSTNSELNSSSNNNNKSSEVLLKSLNVELNTNIPTINEEKVPTEQDKVEGCSGLTRLGEVPQNSRLTLQQFVAVEGRLPMRSATTGRPCCACHTGKANNPQQASCGHICCTPCWVDRFKKAEKSCPNCGKKVLKLKKDLTKLYLS